jgi:hypothetical protein
MHNYGLASLSEFLGDQVIYRNLEPADQQLPGLGRLGLSLGIPPGRIPRKGQADYARLIVRILSIAQSERGISHPIRRLLFVGDTRLLDGTTFTSLCQAGDWPGLIFIGSENTNPPKFEIVPDSGAQQFTYANRWSFLADFDGYASQNGFLVDETTAVILDIDKTLLGARGRNGHVIDQARLDAMEGIIADLIGAAFDRGTFQSAYQRLNQPEYHPFTLDNQDYLAYVCLILSSGFTRLDDLLVSLSQGQLISIEQFMETVDQRQNQLPAVVAEAHREVYRQVKTGDPTPFKSFRREEYLNTIQRFGCLPEDADYQDLLDQEIVITQEARTSALDWKKKGALLLGLSDKPSEAATPTSVLAAQGYQPIHRAVTHSVGE